MIINISDGAVVGETSSVMFTMLQEGPVSALVILKNSGVNVISYRIQEYSGSAWVDLGASGSDYYTTLSAGEVRSFKLTSTYPKVQLLAGASGGAYLEFAISRFWNRSAGGAIPILAL